MSEKELRRIEKERARLGRELQKLRKLKGVSRSELAERVGMSVPNLWRIEVGKQGTPHLPALFRALGSRLDAHKHTNAA